MKTSWWERKYKDKLALITQGHVKNKNSDFKHMKPARRERKN